MGEKPKFYFQKCKIPKSINSDLFEACFVSCERAVDPKSIGDILVAAIKNKPNIDLFLNHEVKGIKRTHEGFNVNCRAHKYQNVFIDSDIVINSSWDQKRHLDSMLDITYAETWNIRYKLGFRLKKQFAVQLPTFVIVHGPFGDFVEFPNQNYTYFSWYPACRIGMTNKITIPDAWRDLQKGQFDSVGLGDVKDQSLSALQNILPKLEFEISDVRGGTIVAYGEKEIDQLSSKLHQRSELAIVEHDGYFSVNSSKFTSAPNNAYKLGPLL